MRPYLRCLFFLVLSFPSVAMGNTMSLPSISLVIPFYDAVESPVVSTDPLSAKPIGFGGAANGGGAVDIHISLAAFPEPVDIYVGIRISALSDAFFMVSSENALLPSSSGLIKWKSGITGPIDESLFGDIPLSVLTPAVYTVYLYISPANSQTPYYLWASSFTSVPPPDCCTAIPSESEALGDYRMFSHMSGGVTDVAVSNRGFRAVAGSEDYHMYYFDRSAAAPVFTYATGDQVTSVDISKTGCAFAAGSKDGKLYFFECGNSAPVWSYDTYTDTPSPSTSTVNDVVISPDGIWLAAVSRTHAYLFSRQDADPLMKIDLSAELDGAFLTAVDMADDASSLAAASGKGNSGSRVFYLNRSRVVWSYASTDLGWGSDADAYPVAVSADGGKVAAGGCDNTIKFWNAESSTPAWSHQIAEDSPVYAVALSDDGKKLAATGNFNLYFFNDTVSGTPAFTYDGEYTTGTFFDFPVVYPDNDNMETYYGVGNYKNAVAMSADGSHVIAGDYNYGRVFGFYTEFSSPLRLYDMKNDYDPVTAVDISPDGSWIMAGSSDNGEMLRIEVAPAEVIEIPVPLHYQIPNETINDLIGGGEVDVEYTVIKPGRAAALTRKWEVWAYQAGLLIPPGSFICQGDMSWEYTHQLADGNVVLKGAQTLDLPQCLSGNISSYGAFILHTELFGDERELFDDSGFIGDIQVGSGGG